MKTFAFETIKGNRLDVKASNIKSAINKIKSIPYLIELTTGHWYEYDKTGLHANNLGWDGGNYKEE